MNPQSQWACVSQDPAPSNESMYNVHDIWILNTAIRRFMLHIFLYIYTR
jgi:hypothetical protein